MSYVCLFTRFTRQTIHNASGKVDLDDKLVGGEGKDCTFPHTFTLLFIGH